MFISWDLVLELCCQRLNLQEILDSGIVSSTVYVEYRIFRKEMNKVAKCMEPCTRVNVAAACPVHGCSSCAVSRIAGVTACGYFGERIVIACRLQPRQTRSRDLNL